MFNWIKKLFSDPPETITPEQVMSADRNIQEICAQAFNAPPEHFVMGHVDKSGKLHTKEIPMKKTADDFGWFTSKAP